MKPDLALTLFGSVFVIIGLLFLPVAWRKIREDLDSRRWPQTTATLKDMEVVKRIHERDAKENYRQLVSYSCHLVYEYSVGTSTHRAEHWETGNDREHAMQIAAGHKAGEQRSIHYNPEAPEHYRVGAVSAYTGLLWLLPFAGFSGFGWLVIYVGRRFYGE